MEVQSFPPELFQSDQPSSPVSSPLAEETTMPSSPSLPSLTEDVDGDITATKVQFDEEDLTVRSSSPMVEDTKKNSLDEVITMATCSLDEDLNMDSLFSSYQDEDMKKDSMMGAGLANLGNTCFLNAVLQCFTHTVPFVESLRSCDHFSPCFRHFGGFCIICVLRGHIDESLGSSGETVWPRRLVDNLTYLNSSFVRYQQEDAHEFLQCFLDKLDTFCLDGNPKDQGSSKEDSFVKKIFGGRLKSQLRCSNCDHLSDTFEPLIDLSLEIEDVDNLSSALESFTKVEKIEETKFTCDNCKEKVLVEKQLTLDQTPTVAAFHLKRFKNDGSYVEKIEKYVEYPLELDLQTYSSKRESSDVEEKYELYAVVVHSGRYSFSGHYFCFIRSSPQTWHQLDDIAVTSVSEEYVLSQEAYILFYKKQGTPWFSDYMETRKQYPRQYRFKTSPKSVLDEVDAEARDDERKIPTVLPVNDCSVDVMNDINNLDFMTGKNGVTEERNYSYVMQDRTDVDVAKDENDVDDMKDRNDIDDCPQTPPFRSLSPDIYAEETPEVDYLIPRAHLRLKSPAPSSRHLKALEDSKRKEALRLTRSMPSSRAMKLRACMDGPKSDESYLKKKRKLGFPSDADSNRRGDSCRRKLNPSAQRVC